MHAFQSGAAGLADCPEERKWSSADGYGGVARVGQETRLRLKIGRVGAALQMGRRGLERRTLSVCAHRSLREGCIAKEQARAVPACLGPWRPRRLSSGVPLADTRPSHSI